MNDFIIMIIDRFTSTPIYSRTITIKKSDEITVESTNDEIILSALLNSIQTIMTQVKIGEIRLIETEDQQIIAKSNDKFIVTALGGFQNIVYIEKIMEFILNYISILREDDQISKINTVSKELHDEFDELILDALKLYSILNVKIEIFKKQGMLGYIPQVHSLSDSFERKIIQRSSLMNKKHHQTNHYYIDYYPEEDSYAFCVNHVIDKITYSCVYQFINVSLRKFLPYKHILLQDAVEQILAFHENAPNANDDYKKQLAIFNHQIRRDLRIYQPDTDFISKVEPLISSLNTVIIDLISTLLHGKPLAVIGDPEQSKLLIDMLSYLTGITDVNLDSASGRFSRIIFIPDSSGQKDSVMKLGYAVYDLKNNKLTGKAKLKYFEKKKKLLSKMDYPCLEKLSSLQKEIQEFWNFMETLLTELAHGVDIQDVMKAIDDTDFKNFITSTLEQINPHLFNKCEVNYSLEKINW